MWQEIAAIAGMKFRFAEEEDSCDLVTRLASNMGWVAPQHLLAAEYLHEEWQPEKVRGLLMPCCRRWICLLAALSCA